MKATERIRDLATRIWRNRGFAIMLVVSALLGPPLYLWGQTGVRLSRHYTVEGTVLNEGTARVDSCTEHGPVTLAGGFGRYWICRATATWSKREGDSYSYFELPPSQITLKRGQVTPDQIGSTVTVEWRKVPAGKGGFYDEAFVSDNKTVNQAQYREGMAFIAVGILVSLPFYGAVFLAVGLCLLLGLLWIAVAIYSGVRKVTVRVRRSA